MATQKENIANFISENQLHLIELNDTSHSFIYTFKLYGMVSKLMLNFNENGIDLNCDRLMYSGYLIETLEFADQLLTIPSTQWDKFTQQEKIELLQASILSVVNVIKRQYKKCTFCHKKSHYIFFHDEKMCSGCAQRILRVVY